MPVAAKWPTVSILMPLLNEAGGLDEVLASLRDQDYGGEWGILAVDGGSADRTVSILSGWRNQIPNLVVIAAPDGGRNLVDSLNLGLDSARGEIVVRADAHTVYEPDYLRRNVQALQETGADLVGGPMRPHGARPFDRAVARVMVNPWVVGPAPYRRAGSRRAADTVYLGAIRRDDLRKLRFQGFRTGVAEDADLAYRIRARGGNVVLDPAIRSRYRPRSSPGRLWKQFFRYGRGKAEMIRRHRRLPSLRPLAPLALVAGLATSAAAGAVTGRWWIPPVAAGVWLGYLAAVVGGTPRRWVAAIIIQLSNGLGLAVGLAAKPKRPARPADPLNR